MRADLVQFSGLPEIERHRDHVGAMPVAEPLDRGGRARAAGVCEHNGLVQLARSLNCFTTACALFGSRAMIRIVSSPAIVPAMSVSLARSSATARICA